MEKRVTPFPGILGAILCIVFYFLAIYFVYTSWDEFITHDLSGDLVFNVHNTFLPAIFLFLGIFVHNGLKIIEPNEGYVFTFYGKYMGSFKENGYWFFNPLYKAEATESLAIRNYAMEPIQVNDRQGVPIEIGATISYCIEDTYKATFGVDDLDDYIDNQFDISLRLLARLHTYLELSNEDRDLATDLALKVGDAGIRIIDAKVTHLVYASDIAASMLVKQQAEAISDAKEVIVKNAVHMAEQAAKDTGLLKSTDAYNMFVTNLILVLCSDKSITPVINVNS